MSDTTFLSVLLLVSLVGTLTLVWALDGLFSTIEVIRFRRRQEKAYRRYYL